MTEQERGHNEEISRFKLVPVPNRFSKTVSIRWELQFRRPVQRTPRILIKTVRQHNGIIRMGSSRQSIRRRREMFQSGKLLEREPHLVKYRGQTRRAHPCRSPLSNITIQRGNLLTHPIVSTIGRPGFQNRPRITNSDGEPEAPLELNPDVTLPPDSDSDSRRFGRSLSLP